MPDTSDSIASNDGKTGAPAGPSEGMQIVILNALRALDGKNDKDWTENGKPSLKRIQTLAKNTDITQADLDATAPDAVRPPQDKDAVTTLKVQGTAFSGAREEQPKAVHQTLMIATDVGYAGGLHKPGEVFLFSGIPGTWMREATKDEIKEFQNRNL